MVVAADIDESRLDDELPADLAVRLARQKGAAVARDYPQDAVLSGDTVVALGRRILEKPADEGEARHFLRLLSGRRHQVHSAICLHQPGHPVRKRLVSSRVSFKRLHEDDITFYIATGEWRGKAGGYAIQGFAARYVRSISGSHSAIVGLPLCETAHLLMAAGLRPQLAV